MTGLDALHGYLDRHGLLDAANNLPHHSAITITPQTVFPSEHPYKLLLGMLHSREVWIALGNSPTSRPSAAPTMSLYLAGAGSSLKSLSPAEWDHVSMFEPFSTLWETTRDCAGNEKTWADNRRGMLKALAYWYFLWAAVERGGALDVPKTIPSYLRLALGRLETGSLFPEHGTGLVREVGGEGDGRGKRECERGGRGMEGKRRDGEMLNERIHDLKEGGAAERLRATTGVGTTGEKSGLGRIESRLRGPLREKVQHKAGREILRGNEPHAQNRLSGVNFAEDDTEATTAEELLAAFQKPASRHPYPAPQGLSPYPHPSSSPPAAKAGGPEQRTSKLKSGSLPWDRQSRAYTPSFERSENPPTSLVHPTPRPAGPVDPARLLPPPDDEVFPELRQLLDMEATLSAEYDSLKRKAEKLERRTEEIKRRLEEQRRKIRRVGLGMYGGEGG